MISVVEKKLIETMVKIGTEDDLIHLVCSNLNEKQMMEAEDFLAYRHAKNGQVTEEEVLKMLLIMTKKKSNRYTEK